MVPIQKHPHTYIYFNINKFMKYIAIISYPIKPKPLVMVCQMIIMFDTIDMSLRIELYNK